MPYWSRQPVLGQSGTYNEWVLDDDDALNINHRLLFDYGRNTNEKNYTVGT